MTSTVNTQPVSAVPVATRTERLARELALAEAGGRAVLLTGHTDDVLLGAGGELMRVPHWLATWAAGQRRDLVTVDDRGVGDRAGTRMLTPPGRTPNTEIELPAAPLAQLLPDTVEAVLRSGSPVLLLVEYCCLHLDHDDGTLLRLFTELALDSRVTRSSVLVVLTFPTRAPRELAARPGWTVVDVGLPDATERAQILCSCEDSRPVPRHPALSIDRLATNLGGMSADALLRLVAEARASQPLDDARVAEVKSTEIRRLAGDTLTVESRTRPMADLAGLANLRLYLNECDAAGMPPGVLLLAGPPGTGKTRSWLAIAHHLGLPPVRLGQLRERWVGASENNWTLARQVLDATAPSCVLLDEADQAGLGHRGEDLDSGVSARLRADLWDFLNNCADVGITVVATTNNPDGLDPAALDRVAVLPVLHPTPTEAAKIMEIEARRTDLILDDHPNDIRDLLAAQPTLLTGRHVVRLLHLAARAAAVAGHPGRVTPIDLVAALNDSVTNEDDRRHELMALSALLLATSRSAWPWVAAARLGESVELPPYLVGLLDDSGEADVRRMRDRITELRSTVPTRR